MLYISTSCVWNVKVYNEGFRVPVLNRRALGCKTISNSMKSNGKYVFFDLLPPSAPFCRNPKFCHDMPGDLGDYFDVIYSTSYNSFWEIV